MPRTDGQSPGYAADRDERLAAYRWLGFVPIGFLLYAYLSYHRTWELLWICNAANLLLAWALFSASRRLLWLATLCLLVGAPMWLIHLNVRGHFFPHSFLTHVIAPILGLALIRGGPRVIGVWKYAFGFGIAVQVLSRAISPPALNVNVSHASYFRGDSILANYWVYWLGCASLIAVTLYGLERAVGRFLARDKSAR